MKVLYTPFSIIAGLVGARIGRKAFAAGWAKISDEPRPAPTVPGVSIPRVATGAALEAASVAAGVAISRALTARAFHHLFGFWPGKEPKKPE